MEEYTNNSNPSNTLETPVPIASKWKQILLYPTISSLNTYRTLLYLPVSLETTNISKFFSV